MSMGGMQGMAGSGMLMQQGMGGGFMGMSPSMSGGMVGTLGQGIGAASAPSTFQRALDA
jgi:hypothetical protein